MISDTGRIRRQRLTAIYLADCNSMMFLAGSMYHEVMPFRLSRTHYERLRHYKSQVLSQIPSPSLTSTHVHHTGIHSPVTEAQEMYDSKSKKWMIR